MIWWLKRLFSRAPVERVLPKQKWHGKYLSEDEIVADMVVKIRADAKSLQLWRDPVSWAPCDFGVGAPENAGAAVLMGMSIRNWYGLWHKECPYTENTNCVIEDGIITDPRFADNMSGRIIDRVKAELGVKDV